MKLNKFLIILAFGCAAAGQTTTAKLGAIKSDGLHRIFIAPEIRSASKEFLDDFRIYDANKNQVPYQFPNNDYDGVSSRFVPYKIISREVVPNKKTSIVVENQKAKTNDIILKIANAEVTKKFSISGSNDLKQWFGLVNQRELSEITNESSTNEVKIIFLPLNSYRYIRFDIDDKKTLPLNILEVGNVEFSRIPDRIERLKPGKITFSNDSERKVTFAHVHFDRPQLISHYYFAITAPNHYNRSVRLFKKIRYEDKNGESFEEVTIDTFTVGSEDTNTIYHAFTGQDFYFEIDNRDNPPLTIRDIVFFQKLTWVVADLKANEKYTVETGNPKRNAPDYDLKLNDAKLRDSLPEAVITDITYNDNAKIALQKEKSIWQQPWFLWTCILVGALAVLYFTISLVKDMKRG